MRTSLFALLLVLVSPIAVASEGAAHLDDAGIDLTDTASLQRGARLYVNYCLGCHSLKYIRYGRVAEDLQIPEGLMKQNLMFTADKLGEPMDIAMPAKGAKGWFGTVPPDLSLVARARGSDWVYTYLRSFYLDEARPLGVNNRVFPDVGMPHVLWPLQGWQRPVYKTEHGVDGQQEKVLEGMELVQLGEQSVGEFDRSAGDLVNFLTYVAEPVRVERERLGVWVLLFLAVFTVLAYFLKKEYWKDVH